VFVQTFNIGVVQLYSTIVLEADLPHYRASTWFSALLSAICYKTGSVIGLLTIMH